MPLSAITLGQNGSNSRTTPCTTRGILVPRVQPALMMCLQVGLAVKQIVGFVDEQGWMVAIDNAIERRSGQLDAADRAGRQPGEHAEQRALAAIRLGRRRDQVGRMHRDGMYPRKHDPQRDRGGVGVLPEHNEAPELA